MGKITIFSKLISHNNKDLALLKDLMRRWSSTVWAQVPAAGGKGDSPTRWAIFETPSPPLTNAKSLHII